MFKNKYPHTDQKELNSGPTKLCMMYLKVTSKNDQVKGIKTTTINVHLGKAGIRINKGGCIPICHNPCYNVLDDLCAKHMDR